MTEQGNLFEYSDGLSLEQVLGSREFMQRLSKQAPEAANAIRAAADQELNPRPKIPLVTDAWRLVSGISSFIKFRLVEAPKMGRQMADSLEHPERYQGVPFSAVLDELSNSPHNQAFIAAAKNYLQSNPELDRKTLGLLPEHISELEGATADIA